MGMMFPDKPVTLRFVASDTGSCAMVRIPPLAEEDVPKEVRPTIKAADGVFGVQSFSAGIQAYCPEILKASRALSAAPGKSNLLSAELRHLVCMRAAQIVTCPF